MADRKNHNECLDRVMNELAESVLELSDEGILVETSEAVGDPQREAERARLVLQQALKSLDNVNKRLSNLGRTINSNDWRPGRWSYHNHCLSCGSLVSFTTAAGDMQGEAVDGLCPESGRYPIRRREASRK
jgi:hypothetical protein